MYFLALRRRKLLPRLGTLVVMVVVILAGRYLQPAARPALGTVTPLTRVDAARNRVALTFDVTWGKEQVTQVLQVLKQERVRATFFVSHLWAATNGELLRQMATDGHEIGTLGVKMVDPTTLTAAELQAHLAMAQSRLARILAQPVRYYRPFGGQWNQQVLQVAGQQRLQSVLWSLNAQSGMLPPPPAQRLADRVVRQAQPGDIIVLNTSDYAKTTAAALPSILQGLRQRGLGVGSVGELLGGSTG